MERQENDRVRQGRQDVDDDVRDNDPSGVGAYTQIEVQAGDGDILVTKTKPVK